MTKSYFKNKVIVITGGAGGIGSALSEKLQSLGAKIAILDLTIESVYRNDTLLTIEADITDGQQLEHAISEIVTHFSKIDILINNAGITHLCKFDDLSESLFDKVMQVNFLAAVNITRYCLDELKKSSGQIVAISSVAGFAPLYGRTAYSASKHAMEGFFSSLATELKQDNVAITIVRPSFVKSRPEIKAKASGGLISPGAAKKNTAGEQISVELAASKIVKAIEKRKPYLHLGRVSLIVKYLVMIFPKLYLKIMTRDAKNELSS